MGTDLVVVEPIDKDVAIIIDEELSPKAQALALIDFAHQCLAEALTEDEIVFGYVVPFLTYVDGLLSKNEDQVRPNGEIAYEFQLIADVLSRSDPRLEQAARRLCRCRSSRRLLRLRLLRARRQTRGNRGSGEARADHGKRAIGSDRILGHRAAGR